MWKKDETPKAPPTDSARTQEFVPPAVGGRAVIGNSLVVEGTVSGDEDLQIEGRVVGEVKLPKNTVTVGAAGNVQATISARVIIVDGRVEGDLVGGEQIEIRRSGHVLGNITSPRVGLEDGAQFKGNIDMSRKETGASTDGKGQQKDSQTKDKAGGSGKGKHEPVPEKAADAKLSR